MSEDNDESEDTPKCTIPFKDHLKFMLHPHTRRRNRTKGALAAAEAVIDHVLVEESCSDLDETELNMYVATNKEVGVRGCVCVGRGGVCGCVCVGWGVYEGVWVWVWVCVEVFVCVHCAFRIMMFL